MGELDLYKMVEQKIFVIRGQKVMIDRDLAELYGVETKYLNRQVKRNKERFPAEFMFSLTAQERGELVTNWHRFEKIKYSSTLPCVFTEHGVAMLSSVLKSKRAVNVNILIIKVFIKMREMLRNNHQLEKKMNELERKLGVHDEELKSIVNVIRQLIAPPQKPKRKIGFHS